MPAVAETVPVHLISLGCARNDVDSDELAGRLEAGGFRLVDQPEAAEAVLVNTCGFVDAAKKDSIDTLLAAADLKGSGPTRAVVAVGCLAERYGRELAESLPEADAVLGFDDYADIADRVQSILSGVRHEPHVPRDRRTLLPLAPSARPAASVEVAVPGHAPASGPRPVRRRLSGGPSAPLKIASGCDRRCTFCAIPSFRGAYVSRPPTDIVAEARQLAADGVREVFLVSENSSSYGKDLGDIRALEALLAELSAIEELSWIRVSYLQPAELRPGLIQAMAGTPKVVPYFDLSFQHASPAVLRRMRRFGSPESFLALIAQIRSLAPTAGIRSNVILGFPGETEEDVTVLRDFLTSAELDAVGVFGYSDEDGTAAAALGGQHDQATVEQRRADCADLVEELMAQRAEARIGEEVEVLIEQAGRGKQPAVGRAAHQGPEVDGSVLIRSAGLGVGQLVQCRVVGSNGIDLIAEQAG